MSQKQNNNLNKAFTAIKNVVTRHAGLKLLSLVFAIVLWSYVINTNTSITRVKYIDDVNVTVNGISTLNSLGYAVSTDVDALLSDVSVEMQVPYTSYGNVTANNVNISVDLASVRRTGTRTLQLRGTTSIGKIVRIIPETIDVEIETYDSRSIPLNVSIENGDDDLWYNVTRINPQYVDIKGASSIVQDIKQAQLSVDVSDRTQSFSRSIPITLLGLDDDGQSTSLLSKSTSSAAVTIEVYPQKELQVSADLSSITVPAEYYVESIEFEPSTITVAGTSEVLSSLTDLPIEPLDLSNITQSAKLPVKVSGLSSFKYISSEQVYAKVVVKENDATKVLTGVTVLPVNVPTGLKINEEQWITTVSVTGPKSRVTALTANDINAYVDLSGLTAGTYEEKIVVTDMADLSFEISSPDSITITLFEDTVNE